MLKINIKKKQEFYGQNIKEYKNEQEFTTNDITMNLMELSVRINKKNPNGITFHSASNGSFSKVILEVNQNSGRSLSHLSRGSISDRECQGSF